MFWPLAWSHTAHPYQDSGFETTCVWLQTPLPFHQSSLLGWVTSREYWLAPNPKVNIWCQLVIHGSFKWVLGRGQSSCHTELISINIHQITEWISMVWNEVRWISWEVNSIFLSSRKEILGSVNRFAWEFLLKWLRLCYFHTTAVLGLQAKMPRGWDYLRYKPRGPAGKPDFALAEFIKARALWSSKLLSISLRKKRSFPKRCNLLEGFWNLWDWRIRWTSFRFSSWHVLACLL